MKRSDRVALIRKLGSALSELDWHDLDLTLRQFGLPWSSQWNGSDKYAYCLEHVERGDDTQLLELHEHLFDGKQFGGAVSDNARGPWADGRFRLFLSHLSRDKIFVSEIKAGLAGCGVDCFVAHEDIEPTKEWEREIEHALSTCDALAAYMTEAFHDSLWTDQEIGFCVRRRVLIIPVRAGRDPYGFISRYQAVPGANKSPGDIAKALFDVLVEHDLTAVAMSAAIVTQFEESSSFAEAKHGAALLRSVKQWGPELLRRVEEAVDRNGQIESAWGVPAQIRSLVELHRQ